MLESLKRKAIESGSHSTKMSIGMILRRIYKAELAVNLIAPGIK